MRGLQLVLLSNGNAFGQNCGICRTGADVGDSQLLEPAIRTEGAISHASSSSIVHER